MFKHPGTPDNDHVFLCLIFNNRESFTTKIVINVWLQSWFICGRSKRDNSNTKIESFVNDDNKIFDGTCSCQFVLLFGVLLKKIVPTFNFCVGVISLWSSHK
jgi:hypothetical protein